MTDTNTMLTATETFSITQAAVENVLNEIKKEIKVIANIYDSRDLFGIAYSKFSDKIIDVIDEYIEK